ncbi:MAG: Ger(x)C family spore germination protein [Tissierellaceae bacterium]|nr:Ger(x)C family spore germination protein [Tissierellaceae bacterium]
MKKMKITSLIIMMVFLSGCFSYLDMNRVYFSTMFILDEEADGKLVLYEEFFASDRGNSEESGLVKRIVLKAEGDSYYEAFSNMQSSATYPIKYDVARAVGLTEDVARTKGIEQVIGSLERDQDITNKVFLFICASDPEEFFNTQMEDEEFLGIWLEDILIFQKDEARILSIRANDYLNERMKGSRVSLLPIIDIKGHPTENRLVISGAAVMKDSKMVDKLNLADIPIYKVLFNRDKNLIGSYTVIYPATGARITVESLRIKTKESLETIDEQLTLVYDIDFIYSIRAVSGVLDLLDKTVREDVERVIEENIKNDGEDFYRKFQKKGIDILDVQQKIERKFRNFDNKVIDDQIFKNIDIVINVDVTIDGSQNTTKTIE